MPILLKILQNIGKENEIPDTEKLNGISGTRRREQFPGGLKGFGSNENGGKNDSFSKSLDEENKKKLLKTLSEKYLLEVIA